ncbi:hypothetical protein KZ843_09210 [Pseudomonas aeruginosa]|nr:hypothetical protein [Pseudomonas aeruginosa]MBW6123061.1 hypothetical protein [Pseudomonas aeruginosa]
MQCIQALLLGLTAALPFTAFADPAASDALVARFASIALPIAKGAVLEDSKGCFWWVRNGEKAPEVVALVDDQKGIQLCVSQRPTLLGPEVNGGDRE